MEILKKLTKRNLKLNKKRTIVTIIGIMLSVALITAVSGVYASGIASLREMEIAEFGNYHYMFKNVEKDDVSTFKLNQKVANTYMIHSLGFAKCDASKNTYKPYYFMAGLNEDTFEMLHTKITEGRFPKDSSEVIVPEHLIKNGKVDVQVGDKLKLTFGKRVNEKMYPGEDITQDVPYDENETFEECEETSVTVVGIMKRPCDNVEPYEAPGYTIYTYMSDEEILADTKNTNDVFIRFSKAGLKSRFDTLSNILGVDGKAMEMVEISKFSSEEEMDWAYNEVENSKFLYGSNAYLVMLDTNPLQVSGMSGIAVVALVVCLIIVGASVFCITNSFDISITEKIKQYGMMRSVGATKKQIRQNVFYEAKILGTIGIPLGLLLGNLATFILMLISNVIIKQVLEGEDVMLIYKFSPIAMVFAVVLGIITIFLSSLKSAYKAGKTSPLVLIRNSGDIKIKAKKLKVPKIVKKVFGMGGEISYKNLKRNKKKYRTTVIAIIVSVTIFIVLNSVVGMLYKSAELDIISRNYNLTAEISYTNAEEYKKALKITDFENAGRHSERISDYINFTENVKLTDEYKDYYQVTSEDEKEIYCGIDVSCIGDSSYREYIKELGLNYEDVKDKGILINGFDCYHYNFDEQKSEKKYIPQYQIENGDVISGQIFKYDEEINKQMENAETMEEEDELYNQQYVDYDIEIALVTKELPFGIDENNCMDAILIISNEKYEKDFRGEYDGYLELTFDSPNPDKLEKNILDYYGIKDTSDSENLSIRNYAESERQMKSLLLLVSIFLYGFIIVIALIGLTNIFNTITTNVSLRAPEFAMLKSVGMTRKEFMRMVRLESIFMGAKSLFYGIILGTIGSFVLYKLLEADEELGKFSIPFSGIGISTVVVIIVIWSIMAYSVSKINKQNIIETIRNENI